MCMSQMSKSRLTLLVSDGIAWYCLVLLGIMWFKLVPDAHTLCHFLFAASVPSSLAPRTASCFLHSHWRPDISVKKRGTLIWITFPKERTGFQRYSRVLGSLGSGNSVSG